MSEILTTEVVLLNDIHYSFCWHALKHAAHASVVFHSSNELHFLYIFFKPKYIHLNRIKQLFKSLTKLLHFLLQIGKHVCNISNVQPTCRKQTGNNIIESIPGDHVCQTSPKMSDNWTFLWQDKANCKMSCGAAPQNLALIYWVHF